MCMKVCCFCLSHGMTLMFCQELCIRILGKPRTKFRDLAVFMNTKNKKKKKTKKTKSYKKY